MCDDWAEVTRLARSKSVHGSTSSPRTDLLFTSLPLNKVKGVLLSEAKGMLIEELGFLCIHSISHRAKPFEIQAFRCAPLPSRERECNVRHDRIYHI